MFVYDADKHTVARLGLGWDPVWSTDGATLIFSRIETERYELLHADLFRASCDGSRVESLTAGDERFEVEPSVADGTTILFRSSTSAGIFRAHLDDRPDVMIASGIEMITIPPASNRRNPAVAFLAEELRDSPASLYFPMPYTNQVYDTPDWYNGSAACGPTSSIMVIAYYGLLPPWNVWCSWPTPGHWSSFGNYVCDKYMFRETTYGFVANDPNDKPSWGGYGYMWSTGSPHTRMASYYMNHGLSAVTLDTPPINLVHEEVIAGYPYTLCNGLTTAGHIIVINGIGSEPHTLIANDPYGDKNSGKYPSVNGAGVRYDWPGYNNGYQNLNTVYWGVSVRPPAEVLSDTVVDDLQFGKGFFLNTAPPASMGLWKDRKVGYGGHFWYTTTRQSDSCFAVWTIAPSRAGNHEVAVHIPFSTSKSARYEITHATGTTVVTIDQSAYDYTWVSLGDYFFDGTNPGTVRLGDGSDQVNQFIVFDAVRWSYRGPLTSVGSRRFSFPSGTELDQNVPNPFNPRTAISYLLAANSSQLNAQCSVRLSVFDLLGREVAVLVNDVKPAGKYTATWDASIFPSGTYFCRLTTDRNVIIRKLLLTR